MSTDLWAAARLEPNDFTAQRRLAIVLISTDSLATGDSILTSLVQAGDTMDPRRSGAHQG